MSTVPRSLQFAVLLLALFILALAPRVSGLADFLTTDEAYHWIDRTARFGAAIGQRRWADTLQTGHPGVTTMWLGSLGAQLELALGGRQGTAPALVAHLAWLRLPSAILQALLVPLGYLVLRTLMRPGSALCGALLCATSPYLIAHSRLLHVDALLCAFVTGGVLLLMRACSPTTGRTYSRRLVAASGICAGLALLSKGPALILLPFAGLLLFALMWDAERPAGARAALMLLLRSVWRYLGWLAIALVVVVVLWPALWADPGRALTRYVSEIIDNGGRPNGDGQFFLGRAIADPGPLFYPMADLFRTTPFMLVGLLALPLALHRQPAPGIPERRTLLALGAFVLFWTLVMTLGPKKFDRYVLPTWPALLLLSGAGLAALGSWLAALARAPVRRTLISGALLAAVLAAEGGQLVWYQPYYLSYYNPLLGGGRVAQRLFLIGWGEGMDQAGAYLQSRADLAYGPVLAPLGATLQPFVPIDVRDVDDFGTLPANYAVVYLESLQRAANPQLYQALQTTIPLRRITIHGIDYALIYQLPRPFVTPLDASFGDVLRIRGVTVEHSERRVTVTPAWDVRAQPASDARAFVHVLDTHGARVAQIDVDPGGGEVPPTSAWQPGQQISVPFPVDLPLALPPGTYDLVLGLYDASSGARLSLQGGPVADPQRAGPNALLLERFVVR
jgi:4-amino-4-deoxy-L-arabinose transferase-like glycosyltransferase